MRVLKFSGIVTEILDPATHKIFKRTALIEYENKTLCFFQFYN